MSYSEVISILGRPDYSELSGKFRAVSYSWDDPWDGDIGRAEEYYVLFVDNKTHVSGILRNGSRQIYGVLEAAKREVQGDGMRR